MEAAPTASDAVKKAAMKITAMSKTSILAA
jgi:hypothetical protein